MKKDFTVVFDLDGTLIDSQDSILTSIKVALEESGINSLVPLTKDLIGPPLLETLGVICGTSDVDEILKVAAKFKEAYDIAGYQGCIRYEGIDELLEWLNTENLCVCLVTNKRRVPTEKILTYLGWRDFFLHVYTIDSGGVPFKNKTEAIAKLIQNSGINPTHAVYVGDRHEDFDAATNNDMRCLLVQWGYGLNNLPDQCSTEIKTIADLKIAIQRMQ